MTEKKLWRGGFTLIELLAVIAIIGILATIAVIGISTATKKARDSRRKTDLTNVKTALELYAQDNTNTYPDVTAYKDLGTKLASYIQNLPKDPKSGTSGYDYVYSANATGDRYVLFAKLEDKGAKQEVNLGCDTDALNPDKAGNGVGKATTTSGPCFRLSTD